jgi:hypothetical protein
MMMMMVVAVVVRHCHALILGRSAFPRQSNSVWLRRQKSTTPYLTDGHRIGITSHGAPTRIEKMDLALSEFARRG